jgi:hypothetical protein
MHGLLTLTPSDVQTPRQHRTNLQKIGQTSYHTVLHEFRSIFRKGSERGPPDLGVKHSSRVCQVAVTAINSAYQFCISSPHLTAQASFLEIVHINSSCCKF